MTIKDDSLKIHFDLGENTLYELGYLSIDIYQLIVFCNLLEENDIGSLENYFYNPKSNFTLTRNSTILKKYKHVAKIVHLQDGSVELFLAGVGALAKIVMPMIANKIQQRSNRYSQEVTFNISTNDIYLEQCIDDVSNGAYGFEDEGLKWLLNVLRLRGYSVEAVNRDVYRVEKVFDAYEQRMTKIIKKYVK